MKKKAYHHGNLKEALVSAGLAILSEKGIEGLSLRNVAKKVGVSHAAPYNHFPNKQALLAAMSTAGHEQLHQAMSGAFENAKRTSADTLAEVVWAYLQFALVDPGRFKLMFSGALEEERDHPAFLEVSRKNISLLEEIIIYCQNKGEVAEGRVATIAIRLWSLAHGFTYLVLENQFPIEYLQGQDLRGVLKQII